MSKFKSDKLTFTRSAVRLAVVFVLSLPAVTPHAQSHGVSPERRRSRLAAQQESHTSVTRVNENGAGHTDMRGRYEDGARSLEVRAKGGLEFTDDDSDVKHLAPGGYLSIEERRGSVSRRLEVVPGADAQPQRTFYSGGLRRAFDREARAWLAEILPDLIRNTAIGARDRVRRIYGRSGAGGVLDEISLIKSEGAKRVYFRELLRIGRLDAATLGRAARQVAREISSDGEKASLLVETADLFLSHKSAAPDFFDAVGTINSDGERRRVLSAVLRRSPGTEEIVRSLRSAREISSDGEKAYLLVEHLALFLDHPASLPTLFDVINSVSSDGEHARVLTTLLKRHTLDRENLMRVLRSAERISSDGEKANVLLAAVRAHAGDARSLSAIADVTKTISSDGEKQRVLSAIARHGQRP